MCPLSTTMQHVMTCSANMVIQTSSQSVPSTPSWFGEVVLVAHHLKRQSVLAAIEERVRFARRRGCRTTMLSTLSLYSSAMRRDGERTLKAFYERVHPFAIPFMALFEREHLPHRSTLSRFRGSR
jgi:hypothetical protein